MIVRDICFQNDGMHFISASFDKTMIFWDTETGKAIHKFMIKYHPYNVRFCPDNSKQNSFLLGS